MSEDLELLREELERALGGLDEHQTQLRPLPDPAKWSIQQIVGHLFLTYAATESAMDVRLAKGTATKATPSVVQRIGQFGLITIGYFPRGRSAPEAVTSPSGVSPVSSDALILKAEAAIRNMDEKVTAAERLFGPNHRAVSHMILGPLSARQWRRFHLIHGRHHINQIAAIRRDHGL